MNLDDKIKHDLAEQAAELDRLMQQQDGLAGYLKTGFVSGISWVMKLSYVIAVVLTTMIVWCGYQFVVAEPEQQLFWGVWLILAFQAQVAIKLWIFMETNRNHTAREIRRLELRLRQNGTT